MGENDNASLQAFILILVFSFSVALITIGVLLAKTRMWDKDRKKRDSKIQSPSAAVGKLMIICGSILAMICVLFMISAA